MSVRSTGIDTLAAKNINLCNVELNIIIMNIDTVALGIHVNASPPLLGTIGLSRTALRWDAATKDSMFSFKWTFN